MLRRLILSAAVLLHALAFAQGSDLHSPTSSADMGQPLQQVAPYVPRFGRTKPVVAVVGENTFTELTDYVVPFGVLTESGVAQVFALSTQDGPIQMFPALKVQPQKTTREFDKDFAQGADYVIVPAVHKTEDPTLVSWVSSQAKKGATIIGVCDGVWVVANAGLLTGKHAVGHWYSFNDLAKRFPSTTFIKDRRYVADGSIITTTGVTASIPVSLALVESIAGHQRAAALAQSLGMNGWGPAHHSADFQLSTGHAWTAAKNWLAFWSHESVGIPIATGMDDVSLALVADAVSRTYRSTAYTLAPSAGPIRTKHGLLIFPDRSGASKASADRIIDLQEMNLPSTKSLDWALDYIAKAYGPSTSAFVALQIEYPKQ